MELRTIIILILLGYIALSYFRANTCSDECYPSYGTLKMLGVFIIGAIIGYVLAPKKKKNQ